MIAAYWALHIGNRVSKSDVCSSPDYGRKHHNPVGSFEKVATIKRRKNKTS